MNKIMTKTKYQFKDSSPPPLSPPPLRGVLHIYYGYQKKYSLTPH